MFQKQRSFMLTTRDVFSDIVGDHLQPVITPGCERIHIPSSDVRRVCCVIYIS